MATVDRFTTAVNAYREQALNAITLLERPHPFAAMTLACCALDLLSHSLHNPQYDQREADYVRTVRRMDGYKQKETAEQIYYLRCGLVHEFRTGDAYQHISVTADVNEPPQWQSGTLLVSVPHFCKSVRATFERFFKNATPAERDSFADRAFIYVRRTPRAKPLEPTSMDANMLTSTNTFTVSASSTAGPHPEDIRFGGRLK
jgi:hypothetical protein